MSDFIKIMELAAVIGKHRTTVYRFIARGILPTPIKIGGSTVWNRFEINEWLQSRPRFVTKKAAANLIATAS